MAESWIVNVEGRAYGPYLLEQMKAFIAEGRVIPQSLVGQPGSEFAGPAGEDPVLGPLFEGSAPPISAESRTELPARRTATQKFGRHEEESTGERSNIVIITDIKSRSVHGMEEEIFNLGQAYPLLPQVWLLTTDKPLIAIRGLLVPHLGKLDVLFIVDATHDTAAWANFGPEPDSRIRRLWVKPGEPDRKAG